LIERRSQATGLEGPGVQIPQRSGEVDRLSLRAALEERALRIDRSWSLPNQIGRSKPDSFPEFGEAERSHTSAEGNSIGQSPWRCGHDRHLPHPAPAAGVGPASLPLSTLAFYDPTPSPSPSGLSQRHDCSHHPPPPHPL